MMFLCLADAALVPLIEDLFKELAMIEECNKVRVVWPSLLVGFFSFH